MKSRLNKLIGAFGNLPAIAEGIKNTILDNLSYFESMNSEEILDHRKDKFLNHPLD